MKLCGSDEVIDQSARVSYGRNKQSRSTQEIENLIRYLMRNKHTSPFEMVELRFHLKIPIFIMRQLVRHRTVNLNEYSGRYSIMSNEFYMPNPERVMGQSSINKQLSEGDLPFTVVDDFRSSLDELYKYAYSQYTESVNSGVSRELARIQLPLSNYTELYWKIDLHNFFNYISLRDDPSHAQNEIVQLAKIMYSMTSKKVPISCKAFEDYKKNSITFSSLELDILVDLFKEINIESILNNSSHQLKGRELQEFKDKVKKIIERK